MIHQILIYSLLSLLNLTAVVNTRWLSSVSVLDIGQHWSEVDIDAFNPVVMRVLDQKSKSFTQRQISDEISKRSSTNSRRDAASCLSASISETFTALMEENPDLMENDAIKRALELSLLDFAIVHHTGVPANKQRGYTNVSKESFNSRGKTPHEILQIKPDASPAQIKQAYRHRALETHPDKGGQPGEFEAVARAYRIILNASNTNGLDNTLTAADSFEKDAIILKSTAHWDDELKEHRNLVRELYQNHGEDVDANVERQRFTMERLGLRFQDAGASNVNEKNERIRNSCFYLSLACSYLSGIGALEIWEDQSDEDEEDPDKALLLEADDALIMETALTLKRTIEAAVLSSHPEWAAQGMVGEEVQAFSDFLVYTLESQTIISDWAVVVFDTCSGFVDVYRGKGYNDEASDVAQSYAASNTVTVQYIPGHYQPLISATADASRPSLKQILVTLDECGVLYVVTDGSAK